MQAIARDTDVVDALEVRGLLLARGFKRLGGPYSFSIACGQALEITGPNGSGKTTLLRTLAGLLPRGAARMSMRSNGQVPCMLYAGHASAMHPDLQVWENLAFDAAWRGCKLVRRQVVQALEATGMAAFADRSARALSKGQRRRAWLARLALANELPVWLLDEPLSALDDKAAASVLGLMQAHLARGNMLAFATHQRGLIPGCACLELPAPARC